jgi:hypothetical protein
MRRKGDEVGWGPENISTGRSLGAISVPVGVFLLYKKYNAPTRTSTCTP